MDYNSEFENFVVVFFEKWQRQMKVAMVIAQGLKHFRNQNIHLTEDEIAEHLYHLIDKGGFETYGDIKKWRHSEIVPRRYLK